MVLDGAIATSGPIPQALALLADHLLAGEELAPWDVPLVQCLDRAHFQILSAIVALLLTTDSEPSLMVLHVPHVDLGPCTMMTDYFEKLPVCLVVVESIEVNELFSRAQGDDFIFFVESHT